MSGALKGECQEDGTHLESVQSKSYEDEAGDDESLEHDGLIVVRND